MGKFEAVIFDVDGTLLLEPQRSMSYWQLLYERAGGLEANKEDARMFKEGKITYEQWMARGRDLFKAARFSRAVFEEEARRLRPMNGVLKTLATLKQRGLKVGIVSESICMAVTMQFGNEYFDGIHIHRARFNGKGLLEEIELSPYHNEHKARGMRELAQRFGTTVEKVAFVGDGYNDCQALREAGLGVAFEPSCETAVRAAKVVLQGVPMTELLKVMDE